MDATLTPSPFPPLKELSHRLALASLHLHVVKELPLQEVCRALGVRAAQIYMIKHRLSAMVRAELKRLERDFV